MKTKKIKSNKMKMIYILDIVVLVICIIRTSNYFSFVTDTIKSFKSFGYGFKEISMLSFYSIWFYSLMLIIKNFVILAIYLAYRIPKVRTLKMNSKYEVIDNIDYYRERFKNITPAEISLLTDLEIEGKKDLAASILDLYSRRIINFENKNLIINEYNEETLKESEKLLISMLQNRNFNSYSMKTWKDLCTHEAISDNFIKEKENKVTPFGFISKMSIIGRWLGVFFLSVFIGACYMTTPHFKKTYDEINTYTEKTEDLTQDEILKMVETDKEFRTLLYNSYTDSLPLALIGIGLLGSMFALASMPVYLKIRKYTHKWVDENDKYERTSEGKILVEQIAGMKNFIHDFSNLSTEEKDSVILWNDFLVYAVLLEENDKVVKEIFNYKKVDTSILEKVNFNINIQ